MISAAGQDGNAEVGGVPSAECVVYPQQSGAAQRTDCAGGHRGGTALMLLESEESPEKNLAAGREQNGCPNA